MTPGSRRLHLVSQEDFADGEVRLVETAELAVSVCRDGDRWYAVDDACPHRGLSLSTGSLEGSVLTCSWHGYRFDLSSEGACLDAGVAPLICHRLFVEPDGIWLDVMPGESGPVC